MKRYLWIIFILMFSNSIFAKVKTDYSPIQIGAPSEKIYLEIRPEIELLARVLSQTTWMEQYTAQGTRNEYFRDLKEFFGRYKNHKAVKIAERLTYSGFVHDIPLNFILSLGPLPQLDLERDYRINLEPGFNSIAEMENLRVELSKLAKESNFAGFYQQHRDYLESVVKSCEEGFNGIKLVSYLEQFFGVSADEYRLIFAPAFLPGGGYGLNIKTEKNVDKFYYICREIGSSNGKPIFPTGVELEFLSLHEWGHSFVNPVLEREKQLLEKLQPLYYPVKGKMSIKGYGTVEAFFNEQIIRAMVLTAMEDLFGRAEYQVRLAAEVRRGFYLSEFSVNQLRYYQHNRDKYKTFVDFAPYLLDQYHVNMNQLLK